MLDPVEMLNGISSQLKIVLAIAIILLVLLYVFLKYIYSPGGSIKEAFRNLIDLIMDMFNKN